jgi:hypothetical protein
VAWLSVMNDAFPSFHGDIQSFVMPLAPLNEGRATKADFT